MYDQVLQLSFSRNVQEKIQDIKEEIRKNNIEDKEREWKPHITLCTTNDLREATKIAKKKFKEFTTQIKYLWVYNSNLKLIKKYELK